MILLGMIKYKINTNQIKYTTANDKVSDVNYVFLYSMKVLRQIDSGIAQYKRGNERILWGTRNQRWQTKESKMYVKISNISIYDMKYEYIWN